ncbi:protein maelstrom homolog isoform X5 [Mobula birostris]|uniref:protein maelstrom homolog isoform X5 n=1 Tax=Mobula birostris TaxID=1983395 RepID=UPI003B28B778
MPRKKPVRNAYYFFMLEKIPELKQKGIEVKGLKDAVPLCSSDWESLNESEKGKYVQMAHQWKAERKNKTVNKFEKNEQQLQNPVHLVATREMNSPPMIWFSDKEICDEVFHFISFLSLADLPSNCEQRFLPCEMACVKYSMKKGIIDEFHCFIDPGGSSIPVNVFEIEELIIKLHEHKLKKKPSKDSVERMLNVIVWDYAMNTRCKWHDERDIVYCALATTKKCAYCISDSLSSIYKFEITAAHIPKREFTYGTILNPKVLVLDHFSQQAKATENLTRHCFRSPSERTSSGKNSALASNLMDYPLAAQFGRGRGAVAAWLNFPSHSPSGFQQ